MSKRRGGKPVLEEMARVEARSACARYFITALPGWTFAVAVAYGLYAWAGVGFWTAALIPAVVIAARVAMLPVQRRYYESEPPWSRMVGASGVALTPIRPDGVARVRGVIWRVRAAHGAPALPEGARVTVRAADGLCLIVEEEPGALHDGSD